MDCIEAEVGPKCAGQDSTGLVSGGTFSLHVAHVNVSGRPFLKSMRSH